MTPTVTGDLGGSFRRGANEEAHRRALWQHQERQERERRDRREQFDQDGADFIDFAAAIITAEQAELLQSEIDTYQLATIEALEENREAQELAQAQLDDIMAHAYMLDDGRRVFKTEDGTKVFDEFGEELSPDVISPEDIPDELPRWESAKGIMDGLEKFRTEQTQLLELQSELDKAQDLLDSGKMTQAQFDEFRERLATEAPDAVKVRAHGNGAGVDDETNAPSATSEAAIDLDRELAAMPMPKPFPGS